MPEGEVQLGSFQNVFGYCLLQLRYTCKQAVWLQLVQVCEAHGF
jgi:hypothetical protein